MTLFRLARLAGVMSLAAVGLSGCLTEPTYSTTPSISFNNIERRRYPNGTATTDSVFITINFQDGDGDLGATDAEEKAAANTKFKGRNFIMTPFVRAANATKFDSLKTVRPNQLLAKNTYYDRFDHISTTTDNRAAPLRGTLTRRYLFVLNGSPGLIANDEVKFTVSILDRAQHQSNEIETTSITIPAK